MHYDGSMLILPGRLSRDPESLKGVLKVRHILDIIKELKVARRLVLPVLSRIGRRDTIISHHYTGDPVRLIRLKHRNYWYMGRRREEDTIALVEKSSNRETPASMSGPTSATSA